MAIAVPLAWYQTRVSRHLRHREFEEIYIQRYWDIRGQLPPLPLLTSDITPGARCDERAVWEYLELCEDEIDLRRTSHITDETWEIWSESIAVAINSGPFRDALDDLDSRIEQRQIPEQDAPLKNLRAARQLGAIEDPVRLSRARRYARGLRNGW